MHVLREVKGPPPRAIVESYDLEQARAVLLRAMPLRAVRVRARVRGATPGALRALLRKLKVLRLPSCTPRSGRHSSEAVPARAGRRAEATVG